MCGIKTLIFLLALFLRLSSSVSDENCTDATPWFCNSNKITFNFEEMFSARSSAIRYIEMKDEDKSLKIPEEFDARKKWPQCYTILHIKNQGRCDICFAICMTAVLSDRYCITHSGLHYRPSISVQDLLACLHRGTEGKCDDGGDLFRVANFLVTRGVTSEDCKPFDPKKLEKTQCDLNCYDKNLPYQKFSAASITYADLHSNDTETHESKLRALQQQIMEFGSVCVPLHGVPDDLKKFEGKGVYTTDPSAQYNVSSMHVTRLIGWGIKDDVPYWLIANSWGTNWGDRGFFKIRRGTNELGVEAFMIAPNVGLLLDTEMNSSTGSLQNWEMIVIVVLSNFFCR